MSAEFADLLLLCSLSMLLTGLVSALADAMLEESDRRAGLREGLSNAVAEGARRRDRLFVVRHIPSFLAGGISLLLVSAAIT